MDSGSETERGVGKGKGMGMGMGEVLIWAVEERERERTGLGRKWKKKKRGGGWYKGSGCVRKGWCGLCERVMAWFCISKFEKRVGRDVSFTLVILFYTR